jgi:signal recognition particle subunit SRP54
MMLSKVLNPDVIDMSRKKRIASGCGRDMNEVNQFFKQFEQMKQMMKGMANMPAMPRMGGRR